MQGGIINLRRDPSPPPSACDRINCRRPSAGRVRLYSEPHRVGRDILVGLLLRRPL